MGGMMVPVWQLQVIAFEDISCSLKEIMKLAAMEA